MTVDDGVALERVPRLSARFRLQFETAQNAWVLLYPEGMVKLSPTAAEIMRRVDGKTTVASLVESLEQAFPGVELRADVIEFLRIAQDHGWLEP
ncbi:MAG TPA: pyrroloquinoline quinone biosynthesis peptide chaperone PqqD [Usitatibacter sp.]|nr:pyrroloquinoline quinone biosynthesis peptide chaperone PqqD [Usitatibacter sp.]